MSEISIRKGNKIISDGKTQIFDSINLAKKESHRIQMRNDGALGRGSVKVERPQVKKARRKTKYLRRNK